MRRAIQIDVFFTFIIADAILKMLGARISTPDCSSGAEYNALLLQSRDVMWRHLAISRSVDVTSNWTCSVLRVTSVWTQALKRRRQRRVQM